MWHASRCSCCRGEQHLDEQKPEGAVNEAVKQVAFADRLLLNKTDMVADADLARVEARLRTINAVAPIRRCCQSQVPRGRAWRV